MNYLTMPILLGSELRDCFKEGMESGASKRQKLSVSLVKRELSINYMTDLASLIIGTAIQSIRLRANREGSGLQSNQLSIIKLQMQTELPRIQVELIQNKFYYLADAKPPEDIKNALFFDIDQDLSYEGFYHDFGPLNLANIWIYIEQVQTALTNPKHSTFKLYHYTSTHYTKCTNSCLLACAYMIIVRGKTPEQAYAPFKKIQFQPFRDASYGNCSYKCTILDCLRGLHYGMRLQWFQFKKFDLVEYEHYEKADNGDLNWIVPKKFVAFSMPSDQPGSTSFSPKKYVPIFKKFNVKMVIRLSSPTYNPKEFIDNDIQFLDLYFPDGSAPPMNILQKFLKESEAVNGAIAVHCKAGLGRTGSLIAAYAIKHYQWRAADFIGWIRMCRPGSILGPQQYWLLEKEEYLKEQGVSSPIWGGFKTIFNEEEMITQMKALSVKQTEMNQEEKLIKKNGDKGQGEKLMQRKQKIQS